MLDGEMNGEFFTLPLGAVDRNKERTEPTAFPAGFFSDRALDEMQTESSRIWNAIGKAREREEK
ncbi:MAG: hypothetical protein HOO67_08105 [Candidatus Peribacteraceae bacterium]|nr:hypothetical protein [Candidatus Peribacteraceae bacterium]